MNIFLTNDLMKTQTLENAKFIDVDDVEAFIKYCNNNGITSEGVKDKGIYFWKGIKGLWEKIKDEEDIGTFEEMATSGYRTIPNLYISAGLRVLRKEYFDNVESETIQYKIINIGEEKERGYFKKNSKGVWKRRMTPEEIAVLSRINDEEKGNVYKCIIGNKYDEF